MPVNSYRWFRGFNDYDNWQASGVSGEGARSFYYPPKPQKCADCHMPLVRVERSGGARTAMVRSHRFPAANTALPFVNGDTTQLKAVQDFLRDGQISVDVFGLVRGEARRPTGPAAPRPPREPRLAEHLRRRRRVGEFRRGADRSMPPPAEVIAPLDKMPMRRCAAATRCGSRSSSARARSAISSRAAPSTPSTSGSSSKPSTRTAASILHSGAVADEGKGPVDPGAHFYRSLQLDDARQPDQQAQRLDARARSPTCGSSRRAPPTPFTTACRSPRTPATRSPAAPR